MSSSSAEGVGQSDIGLTATATESPHHHRPSKFDTQMGGYSWRTLLENSSNRSRKIRGSNYVQLATVDPASNEPRVRSVVFRGFLSLPDNHECAVQCDEMSCVMRMITDLRSQKVEQVQQHPTNAAELLWWFPKSNEQYRIQGRLIFVGSGKFQYDQDMDMARARKEQWGNLSDAARESFFGNDVPGLPYRLDEEGKHPAPPQGGRDQDNNKLLPPPDNFLLMLLLPKRADYLRLTNMYRQTDELLEDGTWKAQRLNP